MKWSELETIKLVELYVEHECLWNITSDEYKNRNKRNAAYEEIIREMGKSDFGVAELKQKIKNIRSTYNQECMKTKKSKKSGCGTKDVYEPTIKWFPIIDNVLKNTKDNSNTEDNLTQTQTQDSPTENTEVNEEGTLSPAATAVYTQPTPSTSKDKKPAISEILAPKKAKYRKKNIDNLNEAVKQLRAAQDDLRMEEAEITENIAFGRYVGAALDKLPLQQSIMAQNEIQGILTKYRLSLFGLPSSSTQNRSYTPTSSSTQSSSYTLLAPLSHPSPADSIQSMDSTRSSFQQNNIEITDTSNYSQDIMTQAWNFC